MHTPDAVRSGVVHHEPDEAFLRAVLFCRREENLFFQVFIFLLMALVTPSCRAVPARCLTTPAAAFPITNLSDTYPTPNPTTVFRRLFFISGEEVTSLIVFLRRLDGLMPR